MNSDWYIVVFFSLDKEQSLKIKEYVSESHIIVKALQISITHCINVCPPSLVPMLRQLVVLDLIVLISLGEKHLS
jgi:hypothetical protein